MLCCSEAPSCVSLVYLAPLCCATAAGCSDSTEPIAQLSRHQLIEIGQTEAE